MKRLIAGILILSVIAASACSDVNNGSQESNNNAASQYASMTPEEICASLTLEQKAAQMIQPVLEKTHPTEMKTNDYGSVIARIDNWPMPGVNAW